jgi:hypothetical protein
MVQEHPKRRLSALVRKAIAPLLKVLDLIGRYHKIAKQERDAPGGQTAEGQARADDGVGKIEIARSPGNFAARP